MSHTATRSMRRSLGALALLAATATTLHAKPAWISIELPVNPMNPATRDAFLLVHTWRHQQMMPIDLVGRAVGMVAGRRRTVDLTLSPTGTPGEYILRRTWPANGSWVLALTVGGKDDGATALIGVGTDGQVRSVSVPRRSAAQPWGRPVTDGDIDAVLQAVAAAPAQDPPRSAAILATLPLAAGLLLLRRRQG